MSGSIHCVKKTKAKEQRVVLETFPVTCVSAGLLVCFCALSRQQQGGGGGHDAGVVHAGQQEERPHQETEPALSAVRTVLPLCRLVFASILISHMSN